MLQGSFLHMLDIPPKAIASEAMLANWPAPDGDTALGKRWMLFCSGPDSAEQLRILYLCDSANERLGLPLSGEMFEGEFSTAWPRLLQALDSIAEREIGPGRWDRASVTTAWQGETRAIVKEDS